MFTEVADLDFPTLEKDVLAFWQHNQVFEKLRQKNAGNPRFSFVDGPITANNSRGIGVHHAWGRTYKDIFQRYKAMLGYDQRYQNGFDCQGLWVEVEIEKALGLNAKKEILEYGLDRFAHRCRQQVDQSAAAVTRTSTRLGQWMDWPNSYYTYAGTNIEHIWHFLKVCHQREWLYKGHRVMPWCTRCGTSLSQHEMADAYEETVHQAVYLKLPLKGRQGEYILVWTTTPWTLPANVALAVHPNLEYVSVNWDNDRVYLARGALERLNLDKTVLSHTKGADLVGLSYNSPFAHLPAQKDLTYPIVAWDQVGAEEGSGVVHIAPGCGAEDYQLGQDNQLPVLAPIDEDGRYQKDYGTFAGQRASAANPLVFDRLRQQGLLVAVEDYRHRYPHCWRCKEPLLFNLVDEWFIASDPIRPQLLAAAQQVRWQPGYAGKRMADWLQNMGDWCISRKRYWGLPLPFYQSEAGELVVVGSRAELRQLATDPAAVDALPELHRPWIDQVNLRTPAGNLAHRVPEVGDCWLDAGIIPFSTLDYLGGDKSHWARWFPADFVVEMREQTRLWFYSMLFMSVTLEGRPPYRRVMTYEKMHDQQGQPMHKSHGNTLWFDQAVEDTGAEPMRWLFAGQSLGLNMHFGTGPAAEVKRRFLTLWHTYRFFVQYARLDGIDPLRLNTEDDRCITDRWLLARLQVLVQQARQALEEYDLPPLTRAVEAFIDDLSNWYVRLNRRRFWKSDDDRDKAAAYATLYTALVTLTKVLAPILPFLAETLYQNLVRSVDADAPASVHLCPYPEVEPKHVDGQLLESMALAVQVIGLGRTVRSAQGLKVRQPLRQLYVYLEANHQNLLAPLKEVVLRELNVKTLHLVKDKADLLTHTLKPKFGVLGKRYGRLVPQIQTALSRLDLAQALPQLQNKGALTLALEDQTLTLTDEEIEVTSQNRDDLGLAEENGCLVALDLTLDSALRDEGFVREFVHQIQSMRKNAGLEVADRIKITYCAAPHLAQVLKTQQAFIQSETLAASMVQQQVLEGEKIKWSDQHLVVTITPTEV